MNRHRLSPCMSLQLCLAAAVSCLLDLLLHPPARPVWAAAAIGWIGWPLAVEPLCARVHFFDGGVDPRHHCCCVCAACALCIQTPCFQCPARFVCGRVVRTSSSPGRFIWPLGIFSWSSCPCLLLSWCLALAEEETPSPIPEQVLPVSWFFYFLTLANCLFPFSVVSFRFFLHFFVARTASTGSFQLQAFHHRQHPPSPPPLPSLSRGAAFNRSHPSRIFHRSPPTPPLHLFPPFLSRTMSAAQFFLVCMLAFSWCGLCLGFFEATQFDGLLAVSWRQACACFTALAVF